MRLLFDITTTIRAPFEPPVGTTRVERTVLADLYRHLGPDNFTCLNYDSGRFVFISDDELALAKAVMASPEQRAIRPEPGGTPVPAQGPGITVETAPMTLLRRLGRGYVRLYPESMRSRAHEHALQLFNGFRDSWSILPAIWQRRGEDAPISAPNATDTFRVEPQFEPQAFDFAGYTDLITLGNGWDYFNYHNLYDLKRRAGLRIHGFVHDLIAVDRPYFFHDPSNASVIHQHYAELCHLCETLICNSNATRHALDEFIRQESLPRPKLAVAQLPIFDHPDVTPVKPHGFQPGPFVLYVSTVEARKNHILLLNLWRECLKEGHPMPKLVLVGRTGWGVEAIHQMMALDPWISDHVVQLASIGDGELAWLYDHCLFSVYPSLVEGWGLPIGEALGRGKICVHSSDPAQKEAAQDLMPHHHPSDFGGWKATILDLIDKLERRQRLERTIAERFKPITRDAFCRSVRHAIGLE